jgi:hypothetical protein
MCCLLVSGFLTEMTQQIHSLRASGVMSSHFASAAGSEMRTFRKSAGTLWTAPAEIAFLAKDFILHRYATSREATGAARIGPQRKANSDNRGFQTRPYCVGGAAGIPMVTGWSLADAHANGARGNAASAPPAYGRR